MTKLQYPLKVVMFLFVSALIGIFTSWLQFSNIKPSIILIIIFLISGGCLWYFLNHKKPIATISVIINVVIFIICGIIAYKVMTYTSAYLYLESHTSIY